MAEKGIGYFGIFFGCLAAVQIGTCADHLQVGRVGESVKNIEEMVSAQQPQLHTENVLGGPEMETFYNIDGQRLYVTVDGKPVESYLPALQVEKSQ